MFGNSPHLVMRSTASVPRNVKTHIPDNNRLVAVMLLNEGKVLLTGARCHRGRWIGETSGKDLPLLDDTVWFDLPRDVPFSAFF